MNKEEAPATDPPISHPSDKPDLSVDLCGIGLKNPFILASGVLATTMAGISRCSKTGFGAVVSKTLTLKAREGYPGPTAVELEKGTVLNAMGLPNPGTDEFMKDIMGRKGDIRCPLIVSISGDTPGHFAEAALRVEPVAAAVELNISCPHPKPRGGRKILIGQDPDAAARTVESVKKAFSENGIGLPIIVKLPPMVVCIDEIAVACARAGADAIAAVNTVPALEVVPEIERPILGNMIGGQSGASIRPIALRKVAEIVVALRRAHEAGKMDREVPVIGIGGISSGMDAVKFMLAGAGCVQIGSHFMDELDVDVFIDEMTGFMKEKGYGRIEDFRGNALKWLMDVL